MKRIVVFVFILFSLFWSPVVWAQETEHIQSYETNIKISKDGSMGVIEKIEYVFSSPRHGIIREIPVVKTNENGKQYALTINDISVSDIQGSAYTFVETREGDSVVLKIGDADRTISGTHWYIISYTVLGALTYFPGHDELYWNSIGTKWKVPIVSSNASVTLPQTVSKADLKADCFVGYQGEKGKWCTISNGDNWVRMTVGKPLNFGEGATVVIGFPKGIVAVVEPKELVSFFDTLQGKITLVLFGIGGILWYIVAPILVVRRWWTRGRDPKPAMGEVRAWFSAPKTKDLRDLTPAETGSLVDETVDSKDIFGSLVDLARRGYMKIIESKKGVFDFEKQKEWKKDTSILPFERELLNGIFEKDDLVSLKDLDLHDTFETVKKNIYTSLVSGGFFAENPQTIRTIYYVIAFFALVTGNFILFPIALLFGKHMPRKTLYGAQQAAIGRSLKNFLVSQDKQLAFQAKNQMMFEKLLPYAVAFGVEEIWAGRFKDIALKRPDWYESYSSGQFSSMVFAQSIGRAASVSFASSVSAKSSSGFSSGFSGGGSSGGGGGGGGGGSW